MSARRIVLCVLVLGGLTLATGGCAPGGRDASKARSRSVIQSGEIVPAEELRVAEYVNYYEQNLPEPVDRTLGLSLRLGNPQVPSDGGEAWLQIGVQARSAESEIEAPLNLALVIDRSGSMAEPEKMPYLKQSLRIFLQGLSPDDIIAIVAYNQTAEVILPAQRVEDREWIDSAIERLQPGGTTNLHGGMMRGFQEVNRNYDVRRNNRVILLTDGIANTGETDPERIAADALAYNERGIYLSTIGLGRDFNDALLSRLAKQGKGAYHFIDSAEEMDKVFRQEATGLVQKAAADVSVVLEPGPGIRILGLTGYEGQPPSGPLQVKLQDMGTGDSQIVLVHLSLRPSDPGQRLLARAELRYTDLFAQREGGMRLQLTAQARQVAHYDPLQNVEVLRNVTIQKTAEGLKQISRLYQARRYREAWDLAYRLEAGLRRVARLTGEEQMYKDADLMRQYQDTLARWVVSETGRDPVPPEEEGDEGVYGEPGAVPTENVVEIE